MTSLTASYTNVAETTSDSTTIHVKMTIQDCNESLPLVSHEELARHLPPLTPPWVTAKILSFTGMAELNRAYAELGSSSLSHENPFEEALSVLRLRVAVKDEELARVPATGPVIVVANHPFGGVDGLVLGATLLRLRSDVRIITNSVLARITKLAPWFLDVEVFDAKRQTSTNAKQLLIALRHLAAGGLLVVFPAGTVSRFQSHRGGVADVDWSSSVGMLARRSGATVVPCYFAGSNSPMFHAAGLVHPNLGTVLLPRELLARRDSRVDLRIGLSVCPSAIRRFEDDETLTAWLRLRTYDLEEQTKNSMPIRSVHPLAPPTDSNLIRIELSELPTAQRLLAQGPYRVYLAQQCDIPRTLEEIARLRELTFRAVGEGTGCARDLDVFDSSYHHLVLYDADKRCIVGAYRLTFCDEAMKTDSFGGLYANSLFRFRAPMRRELSRAIELGRSFIRPEYQRKPLALALLWRGIGEVLCRNPKYRRLVGPVSISDRYRGSSRRLLVAFLNELCGNASLSGLVEPRIPLRNSLNDTERHILQGGCRNVRELSQAMSELDESGRRVPVLLERYLELGAKVLSLSLDPTFGNCIDAFVVVDLDAAPENILKRFMGVNGYATYRCAPVASEGIPRSIRLGKLAAPPASPARRLRQLPLGATRQSAASS